MITITNIIMTMTMTEIVGPETGINYTTETDYIVEIDCETTIKITIEMVVDVSHSVFNIVGRLFSLEQNSI